MVHVKSPYTLFDPLNTYLWTFVNDLEVVMRNISTYRPLMPIIDFGALSNHMRLKQIGYKNKCSQRDFPAQRKSKAKKRAISERHF